VAEKRSRRVDGLRLRRFSSETRTDLRVVSGPDGHFRAQSFKNFSSLSLREPVGSGRLPRPAEILVVRQQTPRSAVLSVTASMCGSRLAGCSARPDGRASGRSTSSMITRECVAIEVDRSLPGLRGPLCPRLPVRGRPSASDERHPRHPMRESRTSMGSAESTVPLGPRLSPEVIRQSAIDAGVEGSLVVGAMLQGGRALLAIMLLIGRPSVGEFALVPRSLRTQGFAYAREEELIPSISLRSWGSDDPHYLFKSQRAYLFVLLVMLEPRLNSSWRLDFKKARASGI